MLLARHVVRFHRKAVRSVSNAALQGVAIYADKAIVALNKPRGVDSQLGGAVSACVCCGIDYLDG